MADEEGDGRWPIALKCEACGGSVDPEDKFCSSCGVAMNMEVIAIKSYFYQGYEYKVILAFLAKYHHIEMSLRTLKKRLKSMGLGRRCQQLDEQEVRTRMRQELDGAGSLQGYRSMWHALRRDGILVTRDTVAKILREEDPEGCRERRKRRLKRRKYINPGPNHVWHIDGYDKLKPYGFAIHGCIDGFSRKILWLFVDRSNNDPRIIGKAYLDAVKQFGGCPLKVRSDLGTENGMVASAQAYFRNDLASHTYGSSPHNQRIEGWWSFLRRNNSSWWINLFKDAMEREIFTPGNEMQMECLWFCFSGVIQKNLDKIKSHWNSHYIRRSRYETMAGRPNELYFLPELHDGLNFIQEVSDQEIQTVFQNLHVQPKESDYQDYFTYVADEASLMQPKDWREAFELYQTLLRLA